MRLRDLFMILLLCMTVGIVGTSCTGDDGEAGPPGPQGPPGDPAPVDDIEVPEPTGTYSFLKSWGSETGTVACSDDLLMGMGPLPGGDEALTKKITSTDKPDVDGNHIMAVCGGNDGMFSQITPADVNMLDDGLDLAPDAFVFPDSTGETGDDDTDPDPGFVLVKTDKGAAKQDVLDVPSTEFNPPAKVTTNKTFVGGKIFADLNYGSDSVQPGERQDLYSQCVEGTAPPTIAGSWRAVKIVRSAQIYKDGSPVDADPQEAGVQLQPIVTTTTKVCVVLDAHPGATKCFVHVHNDVQNPNNNGSRIALYDGTELTTVVKADDLMGENAAGTNGGLFDADDIGTPDPAVPTTATLLPLKLCSLF